MRDHPLLLRAAGFAVVAWLTTSCAAILGMEDTYLGCYLYPEYTRIEADASTVLTRESDGPHLQFKLDARAPPNSSNATAWLQISLIDGAGGHGTFSTGEHHIMPEDMGMECGFCVDLDVAFGTPTSTVSQAFWATSGRLMLTTANSVTLAGSVTELVLQQVRNDDTAPSGVSKVDRGCTVTIHSITFNKQYPPLGAPASERSG